MLVVVSLIGEVVVGVGAADEGADEDVGVAGFLAEPGGVAFSAGDEFGADFVGDDGGSTVVDTAGEIAAVSHHVACGSWIVAKNIINLVNSDVWNVQNLNPLFCKLGRKEKGKTKNAPEI